MPKAQTVGEAAQRAQEAQTAARSGALQILAAVGQALIPLYHVLVARLFGQTAQGTYASALAYVEILTRAGVVGSDKAMMRFIPGQRTAKRPEMEAATIAAGFRLAGFTTGVLGLGLALTAGPLTRLLGEPHLAGPLRLLGPVVVLSGLMVVGVASTLGARTSRVHLLVRGIAEPFFLATAAVLAWAMGAGVRGLAVAHGLACAALLVLTFIGMRAVFGRKRLKEAVRSPSLPGFARFGLPLGLSEMMNAILQRADIIILTFYGGTTTVAVFAAGEQISRAVVGVRGAFDGVAAPMLAESLQAGDRPRLQYGLGLITRWVAVGAVPLAALLIALRPDLLRLFGPGYVDGVSVMLLLILGHLVTGVLGVTPHVLVMSGRSRLFLWNNLGAAALNVSMNLWLIPSMGVLGAGIAALVSASALQVALAVQVWLLERVHCFTRELVKSFIAGAAVLGAGVLLRELPIPTIARIAMTVVGGLVVYLGSWAILRPAAEELDLFRKVVNSLLRRRRA
jgi:O-antigen/teichoic acid export membrane protein